jgi:hypothetical protein
MHKEALTLRGFYRIKLGEEKKGKKIVVGDSGWHENQVTNLGFQDYVCALMGGLAGSKVLNQVIIGTGGVPATGDTALAGETGCEQNPQSNGCNRKRGPSGRNSEYLQYCLD